MGTRVHDVGAGGPETLPELNRGEAGGTEA